MSSVGLQLVCATCEAVWVGEGPCASHFSTPMILKLIMGRGGGGGHELGENLFELSQNGVKLGCIEALN